MAKRVVLYPDSSRRNKAPRRWPNPRLEMALTLLGGCLLIALMIVISPAGCSTPIQIIFGTATPTALLAQTPTPTAAFTDTPTLAPTETHTPDPTSTVTWTPSLTSSPTPSPSLSPTTTATATATTMPSATPTQTSPPRADSTPVPSPTPSPAPVLPVEPTLLEPESGIKYPNPIAFRWDGPLNQGEAFQVTVWHVKSGKQVQTNPMTEREWIYSLHKDLVGEWRWVVWVVKEGQVLVKSEEWFFWLDPHEGPGPRTMPTRYLPRETSTPKPTPEI